MRIVLLAAISCMLVGSVNGMEKKAKELPLGLVTLMGFRARVCAWIRDCFTNR